MRGAVHLAVLGLFVAGGNAWADKKSHRPWLMVGGHHHRRADDSSPKMADKKRSPIHDNARVDTRTAPMANDTVQEARAPKPPAATDVQGEEVVHQALKYKGTRYRFGGATKSGVDCSGLICRVYEDLKLKKIPRASAALYDAGKPVALAELRPGDLVFFKNTYRRGISHVGIYAGHNKFVHASDHRAGVTVTRLSDPYYQLHYAGARRLY